MELAAKGFRKAAALAPNYAPAHRAVGALALKTRKWEEAEQAYSKAIELDGKTAEYYAGKGLALLGKKRLQAAFKAFRKARELDGKNVTALCGLGYISNFEKNERSAKFFFEQALAADGRCAYAASALKMIYAQRNLTLHYLTFNEGDPPGWCAGGGPWAAPRPDCWRTRRTLTRAASSASKPIWKSPTTPPPRSSCASPLERAPRPISTSSSARTIPAD
jgi:tetratricopeptide (TPR) repeat protein